MNYVKLIADHVLAQAPITVFRRNPDRLERDAATEAWVRKQAREATRVRMTDLSSAFWTSDMLLNDFPIVRPPWDLSWFEGIVLLPAPHRPMRYAVVLEVKGSTIVCTPIPFINEEASVMEPITVTFREEDGSFVDMDAGGAAHNDPIVTQVTSAFFAVTMLHAKNHVIRSADVPPPLSKAHTRKHGHPLLSYYVLDVEPAVKTIHDAAPGQGLKRALHQCRGHFADYRKGKGLFGRLKGLYWISEHARGSAEAGIIAKDYAVKSKTP